MRLRSMPWRERIAASFDPAAWRPLLDRIDEVVIFMPLGHEQIERIVDIQLEHLRRRLAARRIGLEVTDTAKKVLASEGYDPTFGARPLKRHLRRTLEKELTRAILNGRLGDGTRVRATEDDQGSIVLEVADPASV